MIYLLGTLRGRVLSGCLAQLGEHRLYTAGVRGSSPLTSTTKTSNPNRTGRIAKRPNAVDCKSIPSGSVVQIHLRPPFLGV